MSEEQMIELAERCEAMPAARTDAVIDQQRVIEDAIHEMMPSPKVVVPLSYCSSLDAAMSLANGMGGQVTFFKDGTAKAFLWQPYPMAVEGKAATPALALTAACLRARAALSRIDGGGGGG